MLFLTTFDFQPTCNSLMGYHARTSSHKQTHTYGPFTRAHSHTNKHTHMVHSRAHILTQTNTHIWSIHARTFSHKQTHTHMVHSRARILTEANTHIWSIQRPHGSPPVAGCECFSHTVVCTGLSKISQHRSEAR